MKIIISLIMILSSLFATIDINNASIKKLAGLKGVGSKKAKAIVAFRDTYGCFSKVEDLKKVKGIGHRTLDRNRANIIIGKCKK